MNQSSRPDDANPGASWRGFLYWLAGARWESLALCPPSERKRVAVLGSTILMSQMEASKEGLASLQAEQLQQENMHRRLVEAIARESAGQPNEFFPEPKKAGQGPRTKDLQRR